MKKRLDFTLLAEQLLGIGKMTDPEQIKAIPREKFQALADAINKARGLSPEKRQSAEK